LPLYAYWHFDNFSWGETRKVSGENSDEEESIKNKGFFDQSKVVLKSLEGWESERQKLEYCVIYHENLIYNNNHDIIDKDDKNRNNKNSSNKKSIKNSKKK